MYKAEMWGDVQWNPTDIAFTTWDENISMALQEEELERLTGGSVESPAATCVPVPSQLLAGEQPATPGCNWWELIQDKRRLRGHRDHSGASSSTDLPTEGSGITSRFGRVREGVDRWHHPDGSIKNRRRERLEAAGLAEGSETQPSPLTLRPDNVSVTASPTSSAVGWSQHGDGPAVDAVTFYEEKFSVRASDNHTEGDLQADDTTTAGDNSSGTAGDTEESASSSDSTWTPGFYRHGEWQPRERTPQEQRLHTGGRGPQRSKRRQDRMDL